MLQIYHHYRHYHNNVCYFCVVKVRRPKLSSHKIAQSQIFFYFAFNQCTNVWISLILLHEQMPSINNLYPTNRWFMPRNDLTMLSVAFLEIVNEQVSKQYHYGRSSWIRISLIHSKLIVSKHSNIIKHALVRITRMIYILNS